MAFGASTVNDFGGAVSDLFAAKGFAYKAKGNLFEKQNYDLAAQLADKNAVYTEASTNVKEMQLDRQLLKSEGTTQADVAGAGFASSGSALDVLRESAVQGALTKSVTAFQGGVQEEGYKEQAESYRNMSQAAQVAIDAAHTAEKGAKITAGIKAAAGVATLFA